MEAVMDDFAEWILTASSDGMPNPFQAIVGGILVRFVQGRSFDSLISDLTDKEARYLKTFIEGMDEPVNQSLDAWNLPPQEGPGFWQSQVLPVLAKRLSPRPTYEGTNGNDFKAVKAAVDLVEIASRHTELTRSGNSYKGRCPLHEDKTPSFVIYPDSQTWNCFGACGERGQDVIELTRRLLEARKW